MKKGYLAPALILGGVGLFVFLKNKKRAGENLQVEPVDIGIDSKKTKASLFTKLYYTVKLNLINSEAANVNVRNVQLSAFINGRPIGTLTSTDRFTVPAKGSQIVGLNTAISTFGIGATIINLIRNKEDISVQIKGSIDTDLGRVNVDYSQNINL